MRPAMKVLHAEHLALRSVARVLMMDLQALEKGADPDFALLNDIFEYIKEFPDRIHHPKEEEFLFSAMRRRISGTELELLDSLMKEHEHETVLIVELCSSLELFKTGGDADKVEFIRRAKNYVNFLGNHIRLENEKVFPLAEVYLEESDWEPINTAFMENDDPMVHDSGSAEKFTNLHRRIMALGAPPMGMR